jgi:hypothetical protein
MWLSLLLNPKNVKIKTRGIAIPPTPKAVLEAKLYKENALVLFNGSVLSASSALLEAEKAASDTPSIMAAPTSNAGFVVNAKNAMVRLAITLPIINSFFRPYLSAAIPRGILDRTAEIPIRVITKPMNSTDKP